MGLRPRPGYERAMGTSGWDRHKLFVHEFTPGHLPGSLPFHLFALVRAQRCTPNRLYRAYSGPPMALTLRSSKIPSGTPAGILWIGLRPGREISMAHANRRL